MAVTRVRVEGLRELQDALQELPKLTAKNVMKRVLTKRAQPIADDAESRVRVKSGKLKISVGVGTKLSRRQRGMHQKAAQDEVEVFVGPGALQQATTEEFGTYKQAAHPYMRPAWDAHKGKLLEGIREDLQQEIIKAAARIARKAAKARG